MPKSKLAPSHSTFIKQADILRRYAAGLSDVTKIAAGIIVPAGVAPIYIRFIQETGALLLRIRGNNAVQDVRIYSKNHLQTEQDLIQFCNKQGWPVK